jgi:hypothetical protein
MLHFLFKEIADLLSQNTFISLLGIPKFNYG